MVYFQIIWFQSLWFFYFEKGSFFNHYPRHRKLISLNKRNTGEINSDFNLRHDWNSLLTNEKNHDDILKFTAYSNSNFPDAGLLVKYMNDYKEKFNLNVLYSTEISNISCKHKDAKDKNKKSCFFEMNDQFMTKYSCKFVFELISNFFRWFIDILIFFLLEYL